MAEQPAAAGTAAHSHRQQLMQRVMRMPDLEVRDHLDRLKACHFLGT